MFDTLYKPVIRVVVDGLVNITKFLGVDLFFALLNNLGQKYLSLCNFCPQEIFLRWQRDQFPIHLLDGQVIIEALCVARVVSGLLL